MKKNFNQEQTPYNLEFIKIALADIHRYGKIRTIKKEKTFKQRLRFYLRRLLCL